MAHRQHGGLEDVDPVNLLHIHHADPPGTARADRQIQLGALCGGQFLGIVQTLGPGLAQHHRSSHNRARQRAAASLVHTDEQVFCTKLGTKTGIGC